MLIVSSFLLSALHHQTLSLRESSQWDSLTDREQYEQKFKWKLGQICLALEPSDEETSHTEVDKSWLFKVDLKKKSYIRVKK